MVGDLAFGLLVEVPLERVGRLGEPTGLELPLADQELGAAVAVGAAGAPARAPSTASAFSGWPSAR